MHDAAFHDAEIVRWIEWAAAGYFRITLVSPWCCWVSRSSDLVHPGRHPSRCSPASPTSPTASWSAPDGFTGGLPNLASWAAFIPFAVIATITVWQRDRSRPAETYLPPQDRFTRN